MTASSGENKIYWSEMHCPHHFGEKAPCEKCFEDLRQRLKAFDEQINIAYVKGLEDGKQKLKAARERESVLAGLADDILFTWNHGELEVHPRVALEVRETFLRLEKAIERSKQERGND